MNESINYENLYNNLLIEYKMSIKPVIKIFIK